RGAANGVGAHPSQPSPRRPWGGPSYRFLERSPSCSFLASKQGTSKLARLSAEQSLARGHAPAVAFRRFREAFVAPSQSTLRDGERAARDLELLCIVARIQGNRPL